MEARIVELLGRTGPLTGAEIRAALGGETFALWKTCKLSPRLATRTVGRHYVRLDRQVEGFARLSPSILREFLTYTVVGLTGSSDAMDARAAELVQHTASVSKQKLDLATSLVTDVAKPYLTDGAGCGTFCMVLAGDVVYGMAHDVNRPERSTGALVHGSDLDIVVIVSDDAPEDLVKGLDDAIYGKKYQYLKSPAFREEIDYIVKRFSRLREQTAFDTFPRMVACKIFDEAELLVGSETLFAAGKELLRTSGVVDRLREMEQDAIRSRVRREERLLGTDEDVLRGTDLYLFYTDDESEEFE